MARVNNEGISGAVGNMIFYTMNGVNYVRSKPGKRKKKRNQAPNPLTSIFGTVSTYGSPILTQLGKYSLYGLKLADYNRVRGWMRNQYAQNYQAATWPLVAYAAGIVKVNNAVDIRDCLLADATVIDNGNGQIAVSVPSLNPVKQIKAPSKTVMVKLRAMAVASSFGEPVTGSPVVVAEQDISYTNITTAPINWLLDTHALSGNIAVVALAMEYHTIANGTAKTVVEDAWLPMAIIAMGRLG